MNKSFMSSFILSFRSNSFIAAIIHSFIQIFIIPMIRSFIHLSIRSFIHDQTSNLFHQVIDESFHSDENYENDNVIQTLIKFMDISVQLVLFIEAWVSGKVEVPIRLNHSCKE